jgi:3-oxoacyl-[acyl-carrier-protein] synthase-1
MVSYALGHAAGILSFEHAVSHIASGRCDACLVGGVDSYLEAETLEWLDSHEQLHSNSTI